MTETIQPTDVGCCTACRGAGGTYEGLCPDCHGTGHCHPDSEEC